MTTEHPKTAGDMPKKKSRRGLKRLLIAAAAVAVVIALLYYWFTHHGRESTDDATIEGRVVPIAPKVGGYVVALHVDDNQHVNAGDPLLEIDPRDYQNKFERAQADLASARARLVGASSSLQTTQVTAPSNVLSARAQVDAAKASLIKADDDLKRYRSIDPKAISRQMVDAAVEAERTARSNLADAQAKLVAANTAPRSIAQAKANAEELRAAIAGAEADAAQAQKDLNDTRMTAPVEGRVTRRTVEKGAYLVPGQTLFSLVPSQMWITANFKETQLEHMRPGQKATIEIDAYPDLTLHGHVDSIQIGTGARLSVFPPENATGNFVKIVQRVPVKIVFDEKLPDGIAIAPGMSVVPTVDER